MGKLDGYGAIVTGAGSGIGKGIVEAFVSEGAGIIAVDRIEERLKALEEALPGKVFGVMADVASFEGNARAVEECVKRFGKVDTFIGNAGIFDFSAGTKDTDPDKLASAFDELFAVNVKGYLLGAKAACDQLARSGGSIILTTSNAGWWPGGGGAIYTASKHAAVGLIHQLAYELWPVRVNGVAPGGTLTDLRGLAALDEADRSVADRRAPRTGPSVGGYSPPEAAEHSPAYVFLASPEAKHTNGTIIDSTDAMLTRMWRTARNLPV